MKFLQCVDHNSVPEPHPMWVPLGRIINVSGRADFKPKGASEPGHYVLAEEVVEDESGGDEIGYIRLWCSKESFEEFNAG